jgi:drug/metabolite transporter (DMT)-like permease
MPKNQPYKNTNGIFLMLIHAFATSMLYVIIKYLTEFISSNQVVFLYKFLVLAVVIPWVLYDGISCVKTKKLKLHIVRGFISTVAALLFFYGLSKVDVASATALNKMEPVLLMIIGAFYFNEKLSAVKVSTIILSCIGMLFVVYPMVEVTATGLAIPWLDGSQAPQFNYNYFIILVAVFLWTANSSIVKTLGKTESNRTQLFYVSLISVLVSFPTALFHWEIQTIAGFDILWISEMNPFSALTTPIIGLLICAGMLHFMHVACYFQSLKIAEMSVVVPFDYTRLVFAGLLGYCFFGNVPSLSSNIGYCLILGSGIYLLSIEARNKRKAAALAKQINLELE